jgi:hypothetical protein
MTYETEGDTFTAGLSLMPSEKTSIFLNLAYTDSTASFDQINVPDPAEQPAVGNFDFTEIHEYSDLDVSQLDFTLNGAQKLTDRMTLKLGGAYRVYDDNEVYLFDGSGDLWVFNAGLSFLF